MSACIKEQFPLITIGVSAYNRVNYLPFCLDSLLSQSYPNCEIIVVDDGSTDGTAELMQKSYPQVKYIKKENGGDASAKNVVAQTGSGEYIVFNDSDDVFYPDTVERLYNAIDKNSPCSCSYGTYQTIDAEGRELPTKRKMTDFPSGDITEKLLKHIIVNSCGTLMPRRFFLECGSFDTALRVCHDWALFLEMSLKGKFYAVQEPVFLRRRHGSNLSSATYAKLHVGLDVLEHFIASHEEVQEKFRDTIRKRRADFHRKLYREAIKEKMFPEARSHAETAFKLEKSFKGFFRMATSRLRTLR